MSIPEGEASRIRAALGYMKPEKVLQWARATICPSISARDIRYIQNDRKRGGRRIGSAADAKCGPYSPHCGLIDNGDLAKKIEAHIAVRSKECGVHSDFYRMAIGWR